MASVFDRPAFRTPFQQESSLPAFQKAIEDTIGALNTGLWRTREGVEIRRIPSIHHLKNQRIQTVMGKVVRQVDQLRRIFVTRLKEGKSDLVDVVSPIAPRLRSRNAWLTSQTTRDRESSRRFNQCILPSV